MREGAAPFLRWTSGAPDGYLGDGATERPATGSPFGTNFFRVDGTEVRLAAHARSVPNQTVELSEPHVVLGAQAGTYSAQVSVPAPPSTIEVLNTSDHPRTSATAAVTDQVLIDVAVWDTTAETLTVSARSSDTTGAAALTVEGFGDLVNGSATFPAQAAPADVVVLSTAGGLSTRGVESVGTTAPILPPLPPEPPPPPEPTPPVPVIRIERCRYRARRRELRVNGTCTGGLPPRVTASLEGLEIGSSAVDATGAWDIRRTFTSADDGLIPSPGESVNVTSAHGGTANAPVTVTD